MKPFFARCPTLMRLAGLALAALLMVGCASLPDSVQRQPSQARTDVADTRLAAVAAKSMPGDNQQRSAMRLLAAGDQAFEARVALARAAEKAIDAQYYQIADDDSGRQFLRALRDAAERGVRVRLLIDDLQAAGEDTLLVGLASRPNIEVRMFNPLAVRDGSVKSRVVFSLHEFSRVNRRMHNKLFIVDNVFAISGGRNIADEYFGRSEPANFIDMDLLSAGPVVPEMSAVFDAYWNSEHAYPVQSVAARGLDAEEARRHFDQSVEDAQGTDTPVAGLDALGQTSLGTQLQVGRVELHQANVRVVADAPRKADVVNATLADGAVMDGTLDLLQSARNEVLVASPYFVPGHRTLRVLEKATSEQVRVSLITNSLATTDEPLAHFGYARYRTTLLDMGVSLYELMPAAEVRNMGSNVSHGSLGRLHAKLAVVDQRWLYIGSMNMDRRSAHSNTEMGLIVDSPELADQVASLLRREQLPQSYRVHREDGRRKLQWVSQGEQQVVFAAEPHLGWAMNLRMSMLGMMVSEELL